MKKNITINELKKEINSGKLLFVNFGTNWCGECKMSGPIIDRIKKDYDSYEFVKLDVDTVKAWVEDGDKEFAIKKVPTFFIYKNGKRIDESFGFHSEAKFRTLLNKNK